jgi:hypothetical protein
MRLVVLFAIVPFSAACGDNFHPTGGGDDHAAVDAAPDGPDLSAGKVVVVSGDFQATGVLSTIEAPGMHLTPNAVAGIAGQDPAVRRLGDELFVINRFGGNNVTILDATTLALKDQISTGDGTNPQDVAMVGDKLYVAVLDKGEVVVIDRAHANAKTSIDLKTYDTDMDPDCESIYAFGDRLYLTCGLLHNFAADVNGEVIVVDPAHDTVATTIELPKKNPQGWLEPAPHAAGFLGDLLIPTVGNFTDPATSCLVEIATESQGAAACAIEGTDLGGYVSRVAGDWGIVFAYDGSFHQSKGALVHFAERAAGPAQQGQGELLSDLAQCGDYLFASDNAAGAKGVRVFKISDGTTATESTTDAFDVGLPPVGADAIGCMVLPR